MQPTTHTIEQKTNRLEELLDSTSSRAGDLFRKHMKLQALRDASTTPTGKKYYDKKMTKLRVELADAINSVEMFDRYKMQIQQAQASSIQESSVTADSVQS